MANLLFCSVLPGRPQQALGLEPHKLLPELHNKIFKQAVLETSPVEEAQIFLPGRARMPDCIDQETCYKILFSKTTRLVSRKKANATRLD